MMNGDDIDVDKDLITLSSQHDLVELMSLQLNTITVHIIAQLPISPIDMIKATLQPLRKISSSTSPSHIAIMSLPNTRNNTIKHIQITK